ncbi:MAG: inositol monophosphatase family protein [Pseudomonadota bacterium]
MTRLVSRAELFAAAARADSRMYHALRTVDILADLMLHYYHRDYSVAYDETEHEPDLFSDIKDSPGAVKLAVDLSCDRLARAYLTGLYPDLGYVGEESFDPRELARDRFWAVDPICGSLGYYKKTGYFGTSVALVDGRVGPLLGALNCPWLKIAGLASREKGLAWLQGDFQPPPSPGLNVVVSANARGHPRMARMLELLGPGAVHFQESFPAKALGVLAGTYDLCFGFPKEGPGGGPKIWDLAASAAFSERRDFILTDFRGRPHDLTGRDGYKFRGGYIMAGSGKALELCLEAGERLGLA